MRRDFYWTLFVTNKKPRRYSHEFCAHFRENDAPVSSETEFSAFKSAQTRPNLAASVVPTLPTFGLCGSVVSLIGEDQDNYL